MNYSFLISYNHCYCGCCVYYCSQSLVALVGTLVDMVGNLVALVDTLVALAATLVALVDTLVALVATLVAPLDVILLAPSTVYGYGDPARLGLRHQLPLSHRRLLPAAASPVTRRRNKRRNPRQEAVEHLGSSTACSVSRYITCRCSGRSNSTAADILMISR